MTDQYTDKAREWAKNNRPDLLHFPKLMESFAALLREVAFEAEFEGLRGLLPYVHWEINERWILASHVEDRLKIITRLRAQRSESEEKKGGEGK